jgi:hypothetical protein
MTKYYFTYRPWVPKEYSNDGVMFLGFGLVKKM